MATFIFTFLFFLSIVAAMAVGVILKDKPIKGSCGGLSAIGMKESCVICGTDSKQQVSVEASGTGGNFYEVR